MASQCQGEKREVKNTLYELLVYKEWTIEPENWRNVTRDSLLASKISLPWWSAAYRWFTGFPWPQEEIAEYAVMLLPWQISLSPNGKIVAILEDTVLEMRAAKDEYTTATARASVPRDLRPQLRKLCWSPDSRLIAVSSSDGTVRVYDYYGSLILKIPLIVYEDVIVDKLIAGVEFIDSRDKKCQWELLIIYINGVLDCYHISSVDKCWLAHSIKLARSGICTTAYNHKYGILYGSVRPLNVLNNESTALSSGLGAWRLVKDAPYYERISPTNDEMAILQGLGTIWKLFALLTGNNCICKIAISSNNNFIASLHLSGFVTIWFGPNLRIHSRIDTLDSKKIMAIKEFSTCTHIVDIEWRKDNKLIVVWKNGTITIHDTGMSVILSFFGRDFINGLPRLTSASTINGFLALECEPICLSRPSLAASTVSDSFTEDEKSFLNTTSDLFQSTMYLLTDLEQYEPKNKSLKAVQRVFRLLGVKLTTPEELFNRALNDNDFERAFEISEEYGLEVMKVYQRQWRISEVNDYSIEEYLMYVRDKEWVLRECVERVPESLSGARALIEFGLRFTDIRSVLNDQKKSNIPLSDIQRQYIKTRITLLDYFEKLKIYEQIVNESSYRMKEFDRYRKQSIIDSVVDFARSANTPVVKLLMTVYGPSVMHYWLNILDNYPETISPMKYSSLLPECDGEGKLVTWEFDYAKEKKDWAITDYSSGFFDSGNISKSIHFDEVYHLDSYSLTQWYTDRALIIEKNSTMIENSVELLKLGIARNIQNLEELLYRFQMLSTLVYEMNLDLCFTTFCQKSILQKLLLFVQKDEDFCTNMVKLVHPIMDRYTEKGSSEWCVFLKGVLVNKSMKSLIPVIKYFKYVLKGNMDLLGSPEILVGTMLDCIYSYGFTNQLDDCEVLIVDALSWLSSLAHSVRCDCCCKKKKKNFFKALNSIRDEIKGARILLKNNYEKSLFFIHEVKEDLTKTKLFMNEFIEALIKSSEPYLVNWEPILIELLALQQNCFSSIPVEYCYEVYVSHMLISGSIEWIEKSSDILCCSASVPGKHLNFESSIEIVIKATQYYSNLSSHFGDKFMMLAKTCLLLIKEDNKQIQEELDFITALRLLTELGLKILPIQVRQTKDKMKLIDVCLEQNSRAYRNPHVIHKLASKLQLYNKRVKGYECGVTLRIAEEAFRRADYDRSAEFCNELITKEYEKGWKICLKLGECEEYENILTKIKCLVFASIHAPSRILPQIFMKRDSLKLKKLCLDLCDLIDQNIPESFEWIQKFKNVCLVKSDLVAKPDFNDFWDEKVFHSIFSETELFLTFPYYTIHPKNCKSKYFRYLPLQVKYHENVLLDMSTSFLKLILLNLGVNEEINMHLFKKVLVACSKLSAQEDSALSLSFLLCLDGSSDSKSFFKSFTESSLLYELQLYYASLKAMCMTSERDRFSASPHEVIKSFIKKCHDGEDLKWFKSIVMDFKSYNEIEQVTSVESGIDTKRFNKDETYKKDTILGLAINKELGSLNLAIDLAKQNNLSVYEVVMSHIISLLLNSEFAMLKECILNENITEILLESESACIERLESSLLYLNIKDYELLISFFSLLKVLNDSYVIWGLTPKEHITLLKKVKSISKDVNYKDLLLCDDDNDLFNILQPAIINDNILVVSKLLKSLPHVIREKHNISKFLCQWAVNEFDKKCTQVSFKQCVVNFESLSKLFTRLSDTELKIFLQSTILAKKTATCMESGIRKQLIIAVVEWCNFHNIRGKYDDLLEYLQVNLDILNKLWDDDYDDWNLILKTQVFLLEEHLRISNDEEHVLKFMQSAVLNLELDRQDLIYLHKVAQIKEPIMQMIMEFDLSSTDLNVVQTWKERFCDVEDSVSEVNNYDTILIDNQVSVEQELSSNCKDIILDAFQSAFPENVLKDNIQSYETTLLFFDSLLDKMTEVNQAVALHKLLECSPSTNYSNKKNFELSLLKSMIKIHSAYKYNLAGDILKKCTLEKQDLLSLIDNQHAKEEKLFICYLSFHSDLVELRNLGLSLIENEDETLIEALLELPEIAICKIIPNITGSDIYPKLVEKLVTGEVDENIVDNCIKTLQEASKTTEAAYLSLLINRTPKGLTSFNTVLNMFT